METLPEHITISGTTFQISPNWNCIMELNQLIQDASFVFTNSGHKGDRPKIVLNHSIEGYDCIEIDVDRYGIISNGITKFNSTWGETIVDSSKRVIEFIAEFLDRECPAARFVYKKRKELNF